MDRLIAINSVPLSGADVAPVSGTPQFATSGNPALGIAATQLPAYAWNAVQEELIAIQMAAGITPDRTNNAQVLAAIEKLIEARAGNYALDTGVANAYVIALNPAVAAYTNGLPIRLKFAHANTGASTIDAGAGPVPLLNDEGAPLAAGDAPAGGIASAVYDAVAGAFLMTGLVPSQALSQAAADALYATIANGVQPGTILPFGGPTPPAGYLAIPTASTNISRTTYAALFAAIGTTLCAGDCSTTFGLPFVASNGTLLQSSANLGANTAGQVISHAHNIYGNFATGGLVGIGAACSAQTVDAGVVLATGGSQNIAAGSYVNFIIKY